jgi:hypothetical protein
MFRGVAKNLALARLELVIGLSVDPCRAQVHRLLRMPSSHGHAIAADACNTHF